MPRPDGTWTPVDHLIEAQRIIKIGEEVVARISRTSDQKFAFESERTAKLDELGKKAMGCWAQAQVHATLATVQPRFFNLAMERGHDN